MKLPVKGTSPASMSWGKEKYVQKAQALIVRNKIVGTPTSLPTSIAKLMIPSAMMQVTGSELREPDVNVSISLNSGFIVALIPSNISFNWTPVLG